MKAKNHGLNSPQNIANDKIRSYMIVRRYTKQDIARIMRCSQEKASAFLEGYSDTRFTVLQIKWLLRDMGMTFEEVFGGV